MVLSRYAFSTEKSRRTRSRPIPGSLRLQTSTLQGNCRQGRARARRVLTDEKTIGTLWSHAHVSLQRESIRGLWPPFRPPPPAGESLLAFVGLLQRAANRILKMTPDSKGGSDGQTQEVLEEVARSTGGQCILSVAGDSLRCTGGGAVRGQELHGHVRLWSAQDRPAAPICAAGERCSEPRCFQRRVSHAGPRSLRAGIPGLCFGIRQIPRPGFERRVRGRWQIVVRRIFDREQRY